jgi:hypothetical protein
MGRITDNRADIYQEVTDQMIAMIEAGTDLGRNRGTVLPRQISRFARRAFPIGASTS